MKENKGEEAMSEEIPRILENHEKRISELEEIIKRKPERILSERKSTEDLITELKDEGFFNEERTMSQVRDALHAKGRIIQITDLPPYLLKMVRNNALKRVRKVVGKRKIWVYFV